MSFSIWPAPDDVLDLARELKNEGMVSQTLCFQGNASYYHGDTKAMATELSTCVYLNPRATACCRSGRNVAIAWQKP